MDGCTAASVGTAARDSWYSRRQRSSSSAPDATFEAVRGLIINADDLGLTTGVNSGIFHAHEHGILTSASLMAGGDATNDAIARARHYPALGIGCHLTLVDGRPLLPPSQVPTLVDASGHFRPSWKPFIRDAVAGRISMQEVERELTAQIDQLASAGIRLTHLDSHKHVHAFPGIFAIVARLAQRFAVPTVRVPWERPLASDLLSPAAVTNLAMWPWATMDRRRASTHGLHVPAFAGRHLTGRLTRAALIDLVCRLRPGVTELMVHPGYLDDDLRALPTRLLASRAEELEALCADETRAAIRGRGVTLLRADLRPVIPTENSRAT